MFKKGQKTTVQFFSKGEGHEMHSTSVPLKDGALFEYLLEAYEKHDRLVIDHISSNGEVHLSTAKTVVHLNTEDKLYDIEQVIRNYINDKALEQEVYGVFAKGEFKGVYNQKGRASLRAKQLLREGYTKEEVLMYPIQMNDYHPMNIQELPGVKLE